MTYFPETVALAMAGGRVDAVNLVRFDFASAPMRLWLGGDVLDTNDGHKWQNVGSLGSIDGIEQAINGTAPEASFTLSGIDGPIMQRMRDDFAAEAKGRFVRVFLQFLGVDDPDDIGNQRALDLPYQIWTGRMLRPSFDMPEWQDGAPTERSVTVLAESIFALGSRPRAALLTDRDQAARFPEAGDRGFEFVPLQRSKVITWPDF